MKTSKEMQLKIIDKMKDNVINGECAFEGIQQNGDYGWLSFRTLKDMMEVEYRIKPETITINGVEIPKPLDKEEIEKICVGRMSRVYSVSHKDDFCGTLAPEAALAYGYRFVYKTKQEAIEVSKALFGIKC